MGYDKIRSMSGQYASYWNAFLFRIFLVGKILLKLGFYQWIKLKFHFYGV